MVNSYKNVMKDVYGEWRKEAYAWLAEKFNYDVGSIEAKLSSEWLKQNGLNRLYQRDGYKLFRSVVRVCDKHLKEVNNNE